MRKQILAALSALPLLFNCAQASQSYPSEQPSWSYNYSDDGGSNSYLGVDISDLTPERVSALKLKDENGVEITMVDQDAPAGKAGLKEHDVILTMNGAPVDSAAQLRRMIHETPAGRIVAFGISRDGSPMTIKVELANRRDEFAHMHSGEMHIEIPPIPPIPPMPDIEIPNINVVVVNTSMRSGLSIENITPQLCEFFGVKDGKGVLIRSVEKGSRADKAGFRAGDVIVRVNGQSVRDTSDFSNAMRSGKSTVTFSIVRDKREQNINLTLPEHRNSGEMIEESIDGQPFLNADSYLQVTKMREQVARLRPEMELSSRQMRKASEEMSRKLCQQSQEIAEQAQNFSHQIHPELRRQLREEQRKLREEMRQFQLETHGQGFDI